MTDTIRVSRELLERAVTLNQFLNLDALKELRALLSQPAADCGLEVVGYVAQDDIDFMGDCTLRISPCSDYTIPVIRKSDADARIAELERLKRGRIDALETELAAFRAERDQLRERVAELEDYQTEERRLRFCMKAKMDELKAELAALKAQEPVQVDCVGVMPPFAQEVISNLQRFQECAEDGEDVDIGRHWLDLLTQLALLNRVQRSPAQWEISQQGEGVLAAHQPIDYDQFREDTENFEQAMTVQLAAQALRISALQAENLSLTVRLENSDTVISSIQRVITRLNKGEPDEQ